MRASGAPVQPEMPETTSSSETILGNRQEREGKWLGMQELRMPEILCPASFRRTGTP